MNHHLHRRKFLSSIIAIPALASAKKFSTTVNGLKTSLNAFSFNAPLTDGTMTISDMLDFCAVTGFEGVDITAYYFKGYPQVPSDEYLFEIKRKAFGLGLEISGTGAKRFYNRR